MAEGWRPLVAVSPDAAHAANPRLFAALEGASGVKIVPRDGRLGACRGEIVIGRDCGDVASAAAAAGRAVLWLGGEGSKATEDARLTSCDHLDPKLRGIALAGQEIDPGVELDPADAVLAVATGRPVWTRTAGVAVYRVAAGVPVLDDYEVLRAGLGTDRPQRMLALLAMLEFLRELDDDSWAPPPLRATFLFDDPNLRLLRYGHIDYRRLAEEAERHGYHVGMAMVPLDAGRPSAEAASIFRRRSDRLSLAIHGNDHLPDELLRTTNPLRAESLAAQALRRVARFEQRTGLEVGRVMVPPHGMCSRAVTAALAELGFDGLCALHPNPWTERAPVDRSLAGFTPATFVDGCAVVARLPLDDQSPELALRAYLGQPLVLYGHHGDVADGYEPLAEAAARVNALGDVQWRSLSRMVRSNYQLRVSDGTARVRAWGTRLDVELPAGVEAISVELAAHADSDAFGIDAVSLDGDAGATYRLNERIPVGSKASLSVRLLPARIIDPSTVRGPSPHPRAWARRRAAELRDQVAPAARRASSMIVGRR